MDRKKLFVDMDGTLYRFHDAIIDEMGDVQIDKMYEKDFFIQLKPFQRMVEALQAYKDDENIEIFILSSVPNKDIEEQKRKVIYRDFPWINEDHQIYVQGNEPKSKFVEKIFNKKIDDSFCLIDDYNKNLREWKEEGGTAIKCINNVNHKGIGRFNSELEGLWQGDFLYYDSELLKYEMDTLLLNKGRSLTIPKITQDPLSVFFKERKLETSVIEHKLDKIHHLLKQILEDVHFKGCTLFQENPKKEMIVITKSFGAREGKYQVTLFNRWKNETIATPAYHYECKNILDCINKIPNTLWLDSDVKIQVLGDIKEPSIDFYSFKNNEVLCEALKKMTKEEFLNNYPFINEIEYEEAKKDLYLSEKDDLYSYLYTVEYGVLLKPSDSEYEFYSCVNPSLPYGFYNENSMLAISENVEDIAKVLYEDYKFLSQNNDKPTYFVVAKQEEIKKDSQFYREVENGDAIVEDFDFFRDEKQICFSSKIENSKEIVGFLEKAIKECSLKDKIER